MEQKKILISKPKKMIYASLSSGRLDFCISTAHSSTTAQGEHGAELSENHRGAWWSQISTPRPQTTTLLPIYPIEGTFAFFCFRATR